MEDIVVKISNEAPNLPAIIKVDGRSYFVKS